jgi:hypothetical protein
MTVELEHANLNVPDLDASVNFLLTALPQFKIRGGVTTGDGPKWLHIGTDSTYLTLNAVNVDSDSSKIATLNHLGFVVENVDEIRSRMLGCGYKEGSKVDPHPYRKRLYLLDHDGMEWEFVEYLSADPKERNSY